MWVSLLRCFPFSALNARLQVGEKIMVNVSLWPLKARKFMLNWAIAQPQAIQGYLQVRLTPLARFDTLPNSIHVVQNNILPHEYSQQISRNLLRPGW
jgi:hypothetical protein